MTRTVARLLAESLQAHDVDLVYCVPGESYLGLTDALGDMNRMRLIVCRHEGGAAFMAVADGRMRDRAGVCDPQEIAARSGPAGCPGRTRSGPWTKPPAGCR